MATIRSGTSSSSTPRSRTWRCWIPTGVGAALVRAAIELARADGRSALVVATAAADVGNLRFYQRLGFRMRSVERDAFTPQTGYPEPIEIDGIPLRDRVWLDLSIEQ
jgi:L-amino acid N-acyltransferase YncA